MKSLFRTLPLVLLVVAVATGAARAQEPYDFVHRNERGPLRGTVTSLSPTQVNIDSNGRVVSVPVEEIVKVTFAEDPIELRSARDQIRIGQYQAAYEGLDAISANSVNREMVSQDITFYKALAATHLATSAGGDVREAQRLMSNFLGAVRQSNNASHHYFAACEAYGDLQVLQGEFDRAALAYRELEAGWPELALHSYVLQARALQLEGKYAEAAAKYEQAASNATDSPEGQRQQKLAVVGRAACMAESGQTQEAITALQKVINDNSPTQENAELFARAYNGLGAAYLQQGDTQDALLAYLHVDLLFRTNAEAHAEALYHLTNLWKELRMNDRSVQARELLQQRYPSSVWARRS